MYNLSFKRTSTRFLGFAPTTVLSILFCNVSSLVLDELSPQNYSIVHYSEYRTLQRKLGKKLRANSLITTSLSHIYIHGPCKFSPLADYTWLE